MARRFRGTPWAPYSLLTGVVVAASFVASTASSVLAETGVVPDSPTGPLPRIGIVAGWGWLALLALRLREPARTPAEASAAAPFTALPT